MIVVWDVSNICSPQGEPGSTPSQVYPYWWKSRPIKGKSDPAAWKYGLFKGDSELREMVPMDFPSFFEELLKPHKAAHKRHVVVVSEKVHDFHSIDPTCIKKEFDKLYETLKQTLAFREDVSVLRQTTNTGGVMAVCDYLRQQGYTAEAAECDQAAGLQGDDSITPLQQWTQCGRTEGPGTTSATTGRSSSMSSRKGGASRVRKRPSSCTTSSAPVRTAIVFLG